MISIKKLAAVTISVALATQMCFVASAEVTKTPTESKIDSHLKEAIHLKEDNEKTPVYIWYKDINYNEVETQVEKLTGLNKDNISVVNDIESNALISKMTSNADVTSVKNDIAKYMKQTEAQRTLEKQNTEKYMSTERKIAKEIYNKKSKKVLDDTSLKESNIKFKSNYSPLIIAELTVDEINDMAENDLIESISLYEELEPIHPEMNNMSYSYNNNYPQSYYDLELDKVRELFDEETLSGDNVKVGLIDNFCLFNDITQMTDATDPNLPYYYTGYCNSQCPKSGNETRPHYHFTYKVKNPYTHDIELKEMYCLVDDRGSINYYDDPSKITEVGYSNYSEGEVNTHATYIIDWICGNNNDRVGIAKDASVAYSGGGYGELFRNIEKMVDANINILLFETLYGPIEESYTELEKWIDHLADKHNITVVVPAGNAYGINNRLCQPALANNAITVGSCMPSEGDINNRLVQFIDGTFNEFSFNYGNECFKFDLMGPCSDTSTSGAAHTGIIALLQQLKPELKVKPELTKAILMASCNRKADQCMRNNDGTPVIVDGQLIFEPTEMSSTSEGALQIRHGAGIVNVFNAVCITLLGQYGYGNISSTSREFNISAYGDDNTSISVATTWLRTNSVSGTNHATGSVIVADLPNLDMSAYLNGNLVATSQKTKSTAEMVAFDLNSGLNNIKADVSKIGGSGSTRFAYAWSTSTQKYVNHNDAVGVYRLKNIANNSYLSIDDSGNISMSNSDYSANQQWILRGDITTENISLQSVSTGDYLGVGSSTSLGYSVISTTTPINHNMLYYNNSILFYLGSNYNYGLYSGDASQLEWIPYQTPTQFILERVPYYKGDLNFDGEINSIDYNVGLQILASATNISPLVKYIADLDGDNSITVFDVRMILLKSMSSDKYEY